VTQLRFLGDLARRFEEDGEQVQSDLRRLRTAVFARNRVAINLTGDQGCLNAMREGLERLLAALPAAVETPASTPRLPGNSPVGICIPGQVCYVARVLPAPRYTDPSAPVLNVLSTHLATGMFYRNIRVEGGAYGGYTVYHPGLGQLALLSFRDPHLVETLEFYDRFLDEFAREKLGAGEVDKAVIGTIGALDRPMDPQTRGHIALERHLVGMTEQDRQQYRDRVLGTDAAALRSVAREILQPAMSRARQAVSAPRERIEDANTRLPHPFELVTLD
jgi:Zn-dependent M16 (insulinase) family peptidase